MYEAPFASPVGWFSGWMANKKSIPLPTEDSIRNLIDVPFCLLRSDGYTKHHMSHAFITFT